MSGSDLLAPARVFSRDEVLTRPCPVPAVAGVYAWYFRQIPSAEIDTSGCVRHEDLTLLYVGIAPKPPPLNGRAPSKQTLRSRVRYHFRGNAAGSTLRLTLGCLLEERLGIRLTRVGSGRLTFDSGEARLSEWMSANAFVCWVATPQPWLAEDELIGSVDLPLNLQGNQAGAFCSRLKTIRATARAHARLAAEAPR
jgi:hypothetical protein